LQLMDRKPERLSRCPEAQALLTGYVEGELSPAERARVEGHMNICAACRKEEAEFRLSLGVLKNAPRHSSPADLYYGFAAKLDAAEKRSRILVSRLRYAGAAVCLLLVVGVSASPLVRLFSHNKPVAKFGVPQVLPDTSATSKDPSQPAQVTVPTDLNNLPPMFGTQSAPEKQDEVGTQQEGTTPEGPPAKRTAHNGKNGQTKPNDGDFLKIQPKEGLSADEAMALARQLALTRKAAGAADSTYVPYKDREFRQRMGLQSRAEFIPDRDERVQVGKVVTRIKTEYQADEEGRRKAVHIEVETFSGPEK
jgi:hypothetical protein